MKKGKISLAALVLLSATIFGGVAKADPGRLDIWNYSLDEWTGEMIDVWENHENFPYNPSPINPNLRLWVEDPNGNKFMVIGIDPNGTSFTKLVLTADNAFPNGSDNVLDLNYCGPVEGDPAYSPLNYEKRLFIMKQDPCSPSSHIDPNIYDILDLTNYFTENAQIWLPNITSSTPRSPAIYDKWNMIISNYADIQPSVVDGNYPDGLVNFQDFSRLAKHWGRTDCDYSNNWCEYADLERDGNVDYNDVDKFNEQWLVDANSIR